MSASRTAATAWGQGRGSGGSSEIASIVPSEVATADLATDRAQPLGIVGVQAADLGGDLQRGQRHRQHPSAGAEQPADPVERLDVVAQELPEADDQEVAGDVAAHLAGAGEAVLEHLRPGLAPLVVAAQGGQRHPQVAGRQHAELARSRPDEPPSSATVTTAVSVERKPRGARTGRRAGRGRRRARSPTAGRSSGPQPSLPPEVAVDRADVVARPRAAGGRSPRSSRRCGACRRCSRGRRHEALALAQVALGDARRAARRSGRRTPRRPACSRT